MIGTARSDVEALEAALAASQARVSAAEAQIAFLKLMIEKLRRALYGQRSERKERLLDQLELALDDLTADASEDDLAAEKATAATTEVKGFVRRKSGRKPFPEHLPRERVVVPGAGSCACCGSERLSKIGEDVTETLEVIPRRWKVIQTVREKFTCRDCEKISQPPAPFHATPRGWAGPNLLATILFEKYGAHQPLNRQSERYAREGVALSTSTLADQVGACAVALKPLPRPDCGARAGGGTPARRRHPCAGAGQGQDRHGAGLGLCARRCTVRGPGPAGNSVPLLAGPFGRSSGSSIFGASPGCCRLTPMPATGGSTSPAARRGPVTEALC